MGRVLKMVNVIVVVVILLSLKKTDKPTNPCSPKLILKFYDNGKLVKTFKNINWFNTPIERTHYNSYNYKKADAHWADSLSITVE